MTGAAATAVASIGSGGAAPARAATADTQSLRGAWQLPESTHASSTWLSACSQGVSHGTATDVKVKNVQVMLGKGVEHGMTVDTRVEPVVDVVIGVEVVGRHVDVVAKQVAADVVVGRKAVKAATIILAKSHICTGCLALNRVQGPHL